MNNKFVFSVASFVLCLVLVITGNLVGGFFGGALLWIGIAGSVVTTVSLPWVPYRMDGSDFAGLLVVAAVVGLLTGCLAFGWWGLAYTAAVCSVYGMTGASRLR